MILNKCHPENVRKYLDKECTKEELDSLKLIINKVHCANQAINPNNIPDNYDPKKAEIFIRVALEVKSNSIFLENDWWSTALSKYSLSNQTNIDMITGKFYLLKENSQTCKK